MPKNTGRCLHREVCRLAKNTQIIRGDGFLAEYEDRFEREYAFFGPIVKEVVERYLDCGNLRCGFARGSLSSHFGYRGPVFRGPVLSKLSRLFLFAIAPEQSL